MSSVKWQPCVLVTEGGVTANEVVADEAQGTNVKKVSQGLSADAVNPLIFLDYMGER
jgi:hypothetical protein